VLDWLEGGWTGAIDKFEKADSIFRRLDSESLGALEYRAWRDFFYLSMGDLEKAEHGLEEAQRFVEQMPKASIIVTVNLAFGLLRLEQRREQEAISLFEKAVEAFKAVEFTTEPLLHIEALMHLTSIYSRRGQREEAQKTFAWAKRLAETLKSDAGLAMATQAEASLLLANDDMKGVQEAYLKSLALWEKAGWPYYHAKALMAYSGMLSKTSPAESKLRLEQAAEVFGRLGAKRDLERARENLRSLTV
jgi:tetratricopeptide (TPR) repeat protein